MSRFQYVKAFVGGRPLCPYPTHIVATISRRSSAVYAWSLGLLTEITPGYLLVKLLWKNSSPYDHDNSTSVKMYRNEIEIQDGSHEMSW